MATVHAADCATLADEEWDSDLDDFASLDDDLLANLGGIAAHAVDSTAAGMEAGGASLEGALVIEETDSELVVEVCAAHTCSNTLPIVNCSLHTTDQQLHGVASPPLAARPPPFPTLVYRVRRSRL